MKRKYVAAFFTLLALSIFFAIPVWSAGKSGTISYEFTIQPPAGAKQARLWIPYPQPDANQDISNVAVTGNYSRQTVKEDAASNTKYIAAEWDGITDVPRLSFSFHVNSHYKKGLPLKNGGSDIPAEIRAYLDANQYIPCIDSKIVSSAKEAIGSATTLMEKARGVYDWTIAHTFRNPDVKGCGLGRAIETLMEARGGGKCADISSVFVTVLRAAGVPSRDVFGLRINGKDGGVTGDFHCWSEFYLPGTGWVQADPADVRKAMLVEKLELQDAKTKDWTEFFWNGDDLFRIALNRGKRGMVFEPAQTGDPLEYFMYPFAQVDGKTLDYFDYKTFSYKVSYKGD